MNNESRINKLTSAQRRHTPEAILIVSGSGARKGTAKVLILEPRLCATFFVIRNCEKGPNGKAFWLVSPST